MTRPTTPLLRPLLAACLCVHLGACAASPSSSKHIEAAESFRTARKAGELDAARAFLSADPRVWYDSKEGEGRPWVLGKGRWREWDAHFNGVSTPGPWHETGNTLWRVNEETNDYYRLIERTDTSRYRITYYFDDAGMISGYMISAADPGKPSPPSSDRFDEFEAWAAANHTDEWNYLRPGGSLDPTGDRPQRTRTLLNQWRATVNLPPIE